MAEMLALKDYEVKDALKGTKVILPEGGEFFPLYHQRFRDIPRSEVYYNVVDNLEGKEAEVLGVYKHCSGAMLLAKVKIGGKYSFVDKAKLKKVKPKKQAK